MNVTHDDRKTSGNTFAVIAVTALLVIIGASGMTLMMLHFLLG